MSFPRYPKYKASGVEWLGEVPEHWLTTPLKRVFELVKREPAESDEIVTAFRDGQVTLRSNRRTEGFTNAIQEHGYQRVLDGDLVIHAMDAFAGAIGVADSDGKSTPVYSVCTARGVGTFTPYYGRLLRHMAVSGFISSLSKGIRERSTEFRWAQAGEVLVAAPPWEEQRSIAAFLDRETAKIDALVAEQERLIELLKEKRQAVTSQAVTKGLNPNAPMKPSGIESLGDVPAHWEVFALKRDLAFITSGSRGWAEHYSDDGSLFIRIGNLTRDSIRLDLSDVQRVVILDGAEGSRTQVRPGDLLFSITADLGSVAVVPSDLERAFVSQHVALVRLRGQRLDPSWVAFAAMSIVGKTWFDTQSYGGTKIQLSLDDVRELRLPVPPIAEQRGIASALGSMLAAFDSLTAEAQRAITLLQERRAALISAAVTGQIDVRGLASHDSAA